MQRGNLLKVVGAAARGIHALMPPCALADSNPASVPERDDNWKVRMERGLSLVCLLEDPADRYAFWSTLPDTARRDAQDYYAWLLLSERSISENRLPC